MSVLGFESPSKPEGIRETANARPPCVDLPAEVVVLLDCRSDFWQPLAADIGLAQPPVHPVEHVVVVVRSMKLASGATALWLPRPLRRGQRSLSEMRADLRYCLSRFATIQEVDGCRFTTCPRSIRRSIRPRSFRMPMQRGDT